MPIASEPALQLAPKPSRYYALLVVLVHGAAAAAALINGLPSLLKIALAAAVASSCCWILWRHVYSISGENARLNYSEFDGWTLDLDSSGAPFAAALLPSSVVTTWVCVLHFRSEAGAFHAFILFKDALDADAFRRLRVLLLTSPLNRPG